MAVKEIAKTSATAAKDGVDGYVTGAIVGGGLLAAAGAFLGHGVIAKSKSFAGGGEKFFRGLGRLLFVGGGLFGGGILGWNIGGSMGTALGLTKGAARGVNESLDENQRERNRQHAEESQMIASMGGGGGISQEQAQALYMKGAEDTAAEFQKRIAMAQAQQQLPTQGADNVSRGNNFAAMVGGPADSHVDKVAEMRDATVKNAGIGAA